MAEKINISFEQSRQSDFREEDLINPTYAKLIDRLEKDGYLQTQNIIDAFRKIDRRNFVLSEFSEEAYLDSALPIGFNQTISQPLTVAFMLELLRPKSGERVLDIGSGSGWQAAILAEIVAETGKVIAVERIKELAKMAEVNIEKYGFISSGRVKVLTADASKKIETEAPFHKIISAASASEIPESWKEELVVGGRIVAPIDQNIVVADKIKADQFEIKEYYGFSFVPLVIN